MQCGNVFCNKKTLQNTTRQAQKTETPITKKMLTGEKEAQSYADGRAVATNEEEAGLLIFGIIPLVDR